MTIEEYIAALQEVQKRHPGIMVFHQDWDKGPMEMHGDIVPVSGPQLIFACDTRFPGKAPEWWTVEEDPSKSVQPFPNTQLVVDLV